MLQSNLKLVKFEIWESNIQHERTPKKKGQVNKHERAEN